MRPLRLAGAWVLEPTVFHDERGTFHEWYRADELRDAVGHDLSLAQASCSTSRRGVLRGVHFADVPPGQAKYLTCVSGSILDVVVDVRVGSPTFGRWESVRLDGDTRCALFLAEGLGHAFMALTDDATMVYLCSTGHAPEREHSVHPLDPDLAIDWPGEMVPQLSPRDAGAPSLADARRSGLLPQYAECIAHGRRQR
ncbi:dTDP-4-dehydrorhamnose 3,5-epimerase family protein [Streptomyces xanthochromogenes]|uniref:dTDP-4-dehydrorhamnose 3,5-epimerase family protein n=1 Tax=Streptomyces xanthochromogenes TaxID=67384 RepID=UPI00342E1E15